ncbi:hypothetical protein TWF694_000713 [Orbilia ellipsospora]|uniref:Uncharacterized protein n=1 Tax=Orbilia ellipsospora TaxID=2528407 RepID=A0AAV9XPJ7_9PEZI
MELDTLVFTGIRSGGGKRHASGPAKLGGNASRQDGRKKGSEKETPSPSPIPGRFTMPRLVPASAFPSKRYIFQTTSETPGYAPSPQ